ncbi:hypothetical protein NNC19_11485 [Clostridium sp. SHJSY1]|uniref:hypothetical protein n=1 Tax=Clostridium sp. SHJSY1 TaxID=2942483 RepID=UPI00287489F1|nr:hypothetical protein [Clostridium sp. SHJSY1]MDS0526303.1 hypothetical protein [Clostridium sp. SHJSY1]
MHDFEKAYEKFFEKNKKYSYLKDEATKKIYKQVFNPESIAKMINAIEYNKPAVLGVLDLVEEHFGENNIEDQWKRSFGAWIAFVLKPFGFVNKYQMKLGNKTSKFSSGACYRKGENCYKKLVVKYEILEY